MPRTTTAKIHEWGTPPEPEPSGWEAIRIALADRPGEWANVGEYSAGSARKVAGDRLPTAEGYEHRIVPSKTEGRSNVWVRLAGPDADDTEPVETRAAKV